MDTVTIHYHKSVAPMAFASDHGQSKITSRESQIDARVYRLYGLMAERSAEVLGVKEAIHDIA